jgi:hypothetical protein
MKAADAGELLNNHHLLAENKGDYHFSMKGLR